MKWPTQPGNGNGGPSLPQWAAPSQLGYEEVVGGWPIAIHYQSQSVPSTGYLLPLLAFPLSFSFYIFVLFSSFTKTSVKIWSLWGHQWHSFKWTIIVRSPKPSLCKSLSFFSKLFSFLSYSFPPIFCCLLLFRMVSFLSARVCRMEQGTPSPARVSTLSPMSLFLSLSFLYLSLRFFSPINFLWT